jgi:hypothetical protein
MINVPENDLQTSIILCAFVFCPVAAIDGDETDPRGALALARMNWLHRQYKIVSTPPITRSCLTIYIVTEK